MAIPTSRYRRRGLRSLSLQMQSPASDLGVRRRPRADGVNILLARHGR